MNPGNMKRGQIVRSRAGKDHGKLYVLLEWNERWAWVADGKKRTINNPKKKNMQHLWYSNMLLEPISDQDILEFLAKCANEND